MRSILIIRQQEEAFPLADLLSTKGLTPYLCPLFVPHFFPPPSLTGAQGLIITSKNALRALRGRDEVKNIPLYVVGDETADFAKNMGFLTILSASGNAKDLIHLVRQKARPDGGILWHLSGDIITGNIQETLGEEGFDVRRHSVYKIEKTEEFPSSFVLDLKEKVISHVLFFSPHTTALFIHLLKERGLEKFTSQMTAVCLSAEVAAKVSILAWEDVWVSPHPTTQAMMEYFREYGY